MELISTAIEQAQSVGPLGALFVISIFALYLVVRALDVVAKSLDQRRGKDAE